MKKFLVPALLLVFIVTSSAQVIEQKTPSTMTALNFNVPASGTQAQITVTPNPNAGSGGGIAITAANGLAGGAASGGPITITAGNDTTAGASGGSVTITAGTGDIPGDAGSVTLNAGAGGSSSQFNVGHGQTFMYSNDTTTFPNATVPTFYIQNKVGGTGAAAFMEIFNNGTPTGLSTIQMGLTSTTGSCTTTLSYAGVPAVPCAFIDSGNQSYPLILATNLIAGGYIDGANQGLVWGTATGTSKGHGTVNTASGYYVNGVPVGGTGATFTLGAGTGACAATSTLVGTSTAGSFLCTGTAGASTIIVNLPTAPHGWACWASDDTSKVVWAAGASSVSSCTLSGTLTTTSDKVVFGAQFY